MCPKIDSESGVTQIASIVSGPSVLPDGNGGFTLCPELLTEEELIAFLRIPEISNLDDYHNVIEHLKRVRKLPRIHICNKTLYPRGAIQKWIEQETTTEK